MMCTGSRLHLKLFFPCLIRSCDSFFQSLLKYAVFIVIYFAEKHEEREHSQAPLLRSFQMCMQTDQCH